MGDKPGYHKWVMEGLWKKREHVAKEHNVNVGKVIANKRLGALAKKLREKWFMEEYM